jgi:hypothetical protein
MFMGTIWMCARCSLEHGIAPVEKPVENPYIHLTLNDVWGEEKETGNETLDRV